MKTAFVLIIIICKDLCKSENEDTPNRKTTSIPHERRMIATIYFTKTSWAFQFENHFSFLAFVKENVILHSGNNFIFRITMSKRNSSWSPRTLLLIWILKISNYFPGTVMYYFLHCDIAPLSPPFTTLDYDLQNNAIHWTSTISYFSST